MLLLAGVQVFSSKPQDKTSHKLGPRLDRLEACDADTAAQQPCLTHLDRASGEAVLKLFQSMNEHT